MWPLGSIEEDRLLAPLIESLVFCDPLGVGVGLDGVIEGLEDLGNVLDAVECMSQLLPSKVAFEPLLASILVGDDDWCLLV